MGRRGGGGGGVAHDTYILDGLCHKALTEAEVGHEPHTAREQVEIDEDGHGQEHC